MIKLYVFKGSVNSQRTRIVLEEKKIPHELVFLDREKKEHKKPEILALNPYGKVPILVEDGVVLYESCIINEYLDETHPEPALMPKDAAQRARIRIMMDYTTTRFPPPMLALRDVAGKDPAAAATHKETLKSLLAPVEAAIGDRSHVLGTGFTLADVALIPWALRFESLGVLPDPAFPNLLRWLAAMKERPSVKATS